MQRLELYGIGEPELRTVNVHEVREGILKEVIPGLKRILGRLLKYHA